jgi:hypothetical protein
MAWVQLATVVAAVGNKKSRRALSEFAELVATGLRATPKLAKWVAGQR